MLSILKHRLDHPQGLLGGLFDCDCACASAPDFSATAAATQRAADTSYQAAKDQLDFTKQVYADSAPRTEELYQLARQVAQQQMGIADSNQAKADAQWKMYENQFAPVERQGVLDAFASPYLNDADRQSLYNIVSGTSGLSGAGVTSEMDRLAEAGAQGAARQAIAQSDAEAANAAGQVFREQMRYGLNPARAGAFAKELQANLYATRAGAANQALTQSRDKYLGLRTGVENFGRNMPNTAGQAFGIAGQLGNSAVANQNTATLSALPYSSFMAQGYGAPLQAAQIAQGGALGYAGLQNQLYGIQQGAATNISGQRAEVTGSTIGAIGSIAAAI